MVTVGRWEKELCDMCGVVSREHAIMTVGLVKESENAGDMI